MASYRGHLMFSTGLGVVYGVGGYWLFGFDAAAAAMGGGITALSGLLPDLDSDSGMPVRTLFNMAGVIIPILMLRRLLCMGIPAGQVVATLIGAYLLIRYVVAGIFKKVTVHRGMFHSVPAMLIAGLGVFLMYHAPQIIDRYYIACGTMLGFFSHLLLDELCSVNIDGAKVRLNHFAGTALKLTSPSLAATLLTYCLLAGLAYLAVPQFQPVRVQWQELATANTWYGANRNAQSRMIQVPTRP